MRKNWAAIAVCFLIAGFIGVISGLWMIATIPAGWIYGVFVLLISLVFVGLALRSKEEVQEEREKPVMDISTDSNDEEGS
jgi:uncharacterized membrane protein YfcA